MDDLRFGRRVRAVRHRLSWRQEDVAARAGVSQDTVSRIERGRLDALQVRTLRRVAAALEMDLRLVPSWRGGDLDRLADEGHAALVARICSILSDAGWTVEPEVSFSIYGERGSIDVVAWHPEARLVLVVEVKTELTSIEETLRRHDAKVRLAPRIVAERFGWHAAACVPVLVLPDTTTARSRVARSDGVLANRYPFRGPALRAWLRAPSAGTRGILVFLRLTLSGRGTRRPLARKRVRTPIHPDPVAADARGA